MIFDARKGDGGILINVDTNQPIRWARWANTDTGEYEAFREDPVEAKKRGVVPLTLLYRGKANLRFIQAKVGNTVSISSPEEDVELLVARYSGQINKCVPVLALPGRECNEPKCHKLATWSVADEQELTPALVDGLLEERATTVGRRYYCDWHYRNPTFTSLRGVTNEVEVGARPK